MKKLLPLLCLVAAGSLLGLSVGMGKLAAAAGWHPIAFMCWSLFLGGLVLLAAVLLLGAKPSLERAHLAYYFVSGIVSLSIPNGLFFSAIPRVGAGFVSLCQAFPPLATYVLAVAFGMERPKAVRAAGILCGLAGAVMLALGKIGEGNAPAAWVAASLAAPAFLALGNIYRSRYWPAGAAALALAPGMLLAGSVPLAAFATVSGIPVSAVPAEGWPLALLGFQAAILAASYALFFTLQKIAGVVYMSQVGSVGMIVGTLFAVMALGEGLSPLLPPAGMLIFLGVMLVNRGR